MATRTGFMTAAMSVVLGAATASAGLIDDFSGDLSAYTATRILKATPAAGDNVAQWEISDGALRFSTATYAGIEQYALTRTDVTLGVGEELQADYLGVSLDSQDIGLYVGAGHPTADVRANYLNVYIRNKGQIFSRGFDGAAEVSLGGGATPANLESLFIARLAADTFELGYYNDGGMRNVVSTRTISGANAAGIGSSIGFYADIRGAGIRGSMDNLRIIPEPTGVALLGLGVVALVARRKR